jgi:hypothetical protein
VLKLALMVIKLEQMFSTGALKVCLQWVSEDGSFISFPLSAAVFFLMYAPCWAIWCFSLLLLDIATKANTGGDAPGAFLQKQCAKGLFHCFAANVLMLVDWKHDISVLTSF